MLSTGHMQTSQTSHVIFIDARPKVSDYARWYQAADHADAFEEPLAALCAFLATEARTSPDDTWAVCAAKEITAQSHIQRLDLANTSFDLILVYHSRAPQLLQAFAQIVPPSTIAHVGQSTVQTTARYPAHSQDFVLNPEVLKERPNCGDSIGPAHRTTTASLGLWFRDATDVYAISVGHPFTTLEDVVFPSEQDFPRAAAFLPRPYTRPRALGTVVLRELGTVDDSDYTPHPPDPNNIVQRLSEERAAPFASFVDLSVIRMDRDLTPAANVHNDEFHGTALPADDLRQYEDERVFFHGRTTERMDGAFVPRVWSRVKDGMSGAVFHGVCAGILAASEVSEPGDSGAAVWTTNSHDASVPLGLVFGSATKGKLTLVEPLSVILARMQNASLSLSLI
jgi:hypothetical protein